MINQGYTPRLAVDNTRNADRMSITQIWVDEARTRLALARRTGKPTAIAAAKAAYKEVVQAAAEVAKGPRGPFIIHYPRPGCTHAASAQSQGRADRAIALHIVGAHMQAPVTQEIA